MECYVDREIAVNLVQKLRHYFIAQKELQGRFGIDIMSDQGRRNIILSHAQEQFLCEELKNKFSCVRVDGRAGASDIYIGDIERELECKITSMSPKTGALLKTDYNTLMRKGKLDYIYVITDGEDFDKFAVIFFKDLTVDDFCPPANGSRGKTIMKRSLGMAKAKFIIGNLKTTSDKIREKELTLRENTLVRLDMMKERSDSLNDCLMRGKDLKGILITKGKERSLLKQLSNLNLRIDNLENLLKKEPVTPPTLQEKFYIELESIGDSPNRS